MAPFGTIYSYPNNFRVDRARAIAAINGLQLATDPSFVFGVTNKSPEFLAKFPLGKVPALETADGFRLTEGQAICQFLAESGPKADQLLGSDPRTRAKINEWVCFSEQELVANAIPPLIMVLLKLVPYDEAWHKRAVGNFEGALAKVEAGLQERTSKFLVGDELTLADIMVGGVLAFAGKWLMDAEMRKLAPSVEGYLKDFTSVEEVKANFGDVQLCETRAQL
ncbi:hypothetical protein OQA88_3122 [Cercophora sp. LCS_1]